MLAPHRIVSRNLGRLRKGYWDRPVKTRTLDFLQYRILPYLSSQTRVLVDHRQGGPRCLTPLRQGFSEQFAKGRSKHRGIRFWILLSTPTLKFTATFREVVRFCMMLSSADRPARALAVSCFVLLAIGCARDLRSKAVGALIVFGIEPGR